MSHWYAVSSWDAVRSVEALRGVCVAYAPCETLERRRGRRIVRLQRPLFPGYLFAYCDIEDAEQFGAIKGADRVCDFVRSPRFDGSWAPVRLHPNDLAPVVLADMFGAFDYTKVPPAYEPKRGDAIKVKGGKWRGYFARVLSIGRRKALVETQWCKLEVETEHLEAA